MSGVDWYRNVDWNDRIAGQFEEKLRRARRKEQYLRIQASTLAERRPDIALKLLDRYFEMPNDFDQAQGHVDRATAYLRLGKIDEAVKCYEAAIAREEFFPQLLTTAWIDLPLLIAAKGLAAQFDRALNLLDRFKARLMFPVDKFKWHAAKAIILHSRNDALSAKSHADSSLVEASRSASGFARHPNVGLVSERYEHVRALMEKYSDA